MENNPRRMDDRRDENYSRRGENDSNRMDGDSRRLDSIHETVANTVAEAFNRFGDGDKGREPPPAWEKTISFAGWRRSVEVWANNFTKPSKKANLLLEMIKKDTDHSGLKELIIQEVIENEDFDYRKEDVVKVILDKIENFVEESKWTKNVRLAREFLDFKQQDGEDMLKYVVRFSALEANSRMRKHRCQTFLKQEFC